tara:strand:+ start:269 stop:1210 length:942 start_codon:yes stop_codon:yes gene_type:complete
MKNRTKKILIYRHCSLGDFILALPAIKMIKDKNPDSQIFLAGQKINDIGYIKANLIPLKIKIVDRYIFFDYNFLSILRFLKVVRKNKFDKIYYLNKIISNKRLVRDFLIFTLLGIKKKIGFDQIKYNYKKFNETYYLCKRVNKNIKKTDISLKGFIQKKNNNKKKYITISMGGRNFKKVWNIKYWMKVIKAITNCYPYLMIKVVGSINEVASADKIVKINRSKIINTCGKTNINALFNVIGNSQYHISHDDGTMHVASCFQKHGVAIFGKLSEKGRFYPSNYNQKIYFPKNSVNDTKPNNVTKFILKDLKKIL